MDELERLRKEKMKKLMRKSETKIEYPDKPLKITDEDFGSTVQKYPLVVVDCWAAWCTPCKMMGPIIDKLAEKYKGKIVFGKLDLTSNKMIPTKYKVRSIPTLLIFKNGELVERIVGIRPDLEQKLKSHIGD